MSSLCSDPLFSCIITLYTLILIFYPYPLQIFLSPTLILTSLILPFLLRLGSIQIPPETERNSTREDPENKNIREKNRDTHLDSDETSESIALFDKWVDKTELNLTGNVAGNKNISGKKRVDRDNHLDSDEHLGLIDKWVVKAELNVAGEDAGNRENRDTHVDANKKTQSSTQIDKWVESQIELGFQLSPLKPKFEDSFLEWNVRAPLEVIYEAYEEGEEEDDKDYEFSKGYQFPSLSMYYPETDSDSCSDDGFPVTGGWDSPESVYLKWEEEDREGMLIEIALDIDGGKHPPGTGFQFEEDNLIEIDISPREYDVAFV
ncbi:hypothetical protein M5689_008712 [Euphorbia peplus]|nr:hypothetical protein M5689_008712 [Euphorbia peplus]